MTSQHATGQARRLIVFALRAGSLLAPRLAAAANTYYVATPGLMLLPLFAGLTLTVRRPARLRQPRPRPNVRRRPSVRCTGRFNALVPAMKRPARR